MKYRIFSFCMVVATVLLASHQKHPAIVFKYNQRDSAMASKLLTLDDATKIMGEPCSLSSNTFLKKADTMEYTCEYTALSKDLTTGKTGKLYFMYEIYSGTAAAANAYAAIYKANSGHKGVETVHGLGTEAYYHTDQTGFYFFLVRKNATMFRMKLNKITSHASETAFKTAAKNIIGRL